MILERVLGERSRSFATSRTWQRSLAKTLTWRFFAMLDTFLISFLVTGKLAWASSIVGIELCTKMTLYFAHERVWAVARLGVIERDAERTVDR
jgi:uncharacterized membrane protein